MKFIELVGQNGLKMPIVGLGTWRAKADEMENAVTNALDCGYRHIDTAFNYNTEEAIGKAIKCWISAGKGKREDLFITTKLPNFGNRPTEVDKYLNLSLKNLQMTYVDLYLVHMPFSFHCKENEFAPLYNDDGTISLDTTTNIIDTWKVMEQQVQKGLAKAIGLSNFNCEQIKRIYDSAYIKPSVLQVELHAYLQQKELRSFCQSLNMAITAYSPLGSPGANTHFSSKYNYQISDFPDILGHPVVVEIADKYGKSPGQIVLKHAIQQNIIVIPKSLNKERIKCNIELFDFELADEDLRKLNDLDRGENGRIFDFFFFKGVEKHPEYPFKERLEGW